MRAVSCDSAPNPGLWVGAAAIGGLLLLPLVVDVVADGGPLRGLLLATVLVAVISPWAVAFSRPRWVRWVTALAVVALAGAAVVSTRELGDTWRNVWLMLAIAVGGMVGGRQLSTVSGTWGVLGVSAGSGIALATDDRSADVTWAVMLTTALAGFSTIVLVRLLATNATLRATRQELADQAVLAERDRFSRDLHDLLGHSLSLVVVKAEAVRRLVGVDQAAAAGHASDIETIGRRALTEVRETVTGIRHTTLATELARAATALTDAGIDAEVGRPPTLLPEPVDEAFAWVVREGATNVIRHSRARRCTVRLEVHDGRRRSASLAILDDGPDGPDGTGVLAEGNGLTGLRDRLALVDGDLSVVRDPDGFGLTATAPLEAAT